MDFKEEDLDKEAVLPNGDELIVASDAGTEKDPPTEATAENKPKEAAPAPVEKKQEDNVPFHQHPRWIQREQEWNKKIEETRSEYEERIAQVEQRVNQFKPNEPVKIPDFFRKVYGEDPELYREYLADQQAHDQDLVAQAKADLLAEQEAQTKAAQQESERWSNWVDSSVQKLKDEGKTFDENRLKAIAIRDMPTDLEGNIDFTKAYNIMLLEDQVEQAKGKEKSNARKELADQTGSSQRGESSPKDYLTNEDIRRGAANL